MNIILSTGSGLPIYEQITAQIKAQVMEGTLRPGDPIPSMRALAKALHISVITVQRAYEDLQRDGFVSTTVGRGSFIAAPDRELLREEQLRQAEAHLQEAVRIARAAGIDAGTLTGLVELFYKEEP